MRRRATRGYTLVALMIGITVMMVLIAAILPLASTQIQRDREEELIFRGRQYAEGVRCFQRKYGRNPTSLKEMFETRPRTLRKLWKDPITNSRRWGIITTGTLTPVGPQRGPGGGSTDGGSFGGDFGGTGKGSGPSATPTPAPSPTPVVSDDGGKDGSGGGGKGGSPGGSGSGGDTGDQGGMQPLMPVLGVHSLSKKKSFRVYQGRDTYDAWQFTVATLMQGGGTGDGPNYGPGGGMGPGGVVEPNPPGGGKK